MCVARRLSHKGEVRRVLAGGWGKEPGQEGVMLGQETGSYDHLRDSSTNSFRVPPPHLSPCSFTNVTERRAFSPGPRCPPT